MKYYPINQEALVSAKQDIDRQAEEYGNRMPVLRPEPGSTMVRILPGYNTTGDIFRKISKHEIFIPGNRPIIFGCAKSMQNLPCAVCEKGEAIMATLDVENMKFAKDKLRTKQKYLFNVVCQTAPPPKRGDAIDPGKVYVLEVGFKTWRQIIEHDRDAIAGWNNVADPENGVNLVIKRVGQKLDTEYSVVPNGAGRTNFFSDCQARGIDYEKMELHNLDDMYPPMPVEEVEAVAASLRAPNEAVAPQVAPSPQPALPTATPAPVVAAPVTPVAQAPVPAAAPFQPVTGPSAVPQPIQPQITPQPLVAPIPQPVVAPAPVDAPPFDTAVQGTGILSTPAPEVVGQEVPQPPAVPAPPTE